jgi:hypothetical protein
MQQMGMDEIEEVVVVVVEGRWKNERVDCADSLSNEIHACAGGGKK